jgi:hypothetical protein
MWSKLAARTRNSLQRAKTPSITIHSLTQKTWNAHIIHSSKDRLSVIRLDDYYQTYRLLAAYVAVLDEVAGDTAAAGPR